MGKVDLVVTSWGTSLAGKVGEEKQEELPFFSKWSLCVLLWVFVSACLLLFCMDFEFLPQLFFL